MSVLIILGNIILQSEHGNLGVVTDSNDSLPPKLFINRKKFAELQLTIQLKGNFPRAYKMYKIIHHT